MNHLQYEERKQFVQALLRKNFNLQCSMIEPIDYDPNCPFPYNNFIYKVTTTALENSKANSQEPNPHSQPGTVSLPDHNLELVMRLSNPAAAGLNKHNRVQNEVAAMSIVRSALAQDQKHLIPNIYGWGSGVEGQQDYILQEFMPGVPLDQKFGNLSSDAQKIILEQIAGALTSIQRYELPKTIHEYGGLTFDEAGNIVSAEMTILHGGPFKTLQDFYRSQFESQLRVAEKSPVIKGWADSNIGTRLNNFLTSDLDLCLQDYDTDKKVLVHGDFTPNNMLWDEKSSKLTAILDFDFAFIGSIADEFMRSFRPFGNLPSPHSQSPQELEFRKALLSGIFPLEIPGKSDEDSGIPWVTAKLWDESLSSAGASKPATIRGIESVSRLQGLIDQISPWMLSNEVSIKRRSPEQLEAFRAKTEKLLILFLD